MAEFFVGCRVRMNGDPLVPDINDHHHCPDQDLIHSGRFTIRFRYRDMLLLKTSGDNFSSMNVFTAMDYYKDGHAELLEDFISSDISTSYLTPSQLRCDTSYRRSFLNEAVAGLGIDEKSCGSLCEELVKKFDAKFDKLHHVYGVDQALSVMAKVFVIRIEFVDPADFQRSWYWPDECEDAMSSTGCPHMIDDGFDDDANSMIG